MAPHGFDTCITLNDRHLAAAGLTGRAAEAVKAVREAVGRMDGAGWIDVEAQPYPPELPGWVILRTPGRSDAPDTPAWRELVRQVEETATGALTEARRFPL
jgi:hypothetical protein